MRKINLNTTTTFQALFFPRIPSGWGNITNINTFIIFFFTFYYLLFSTVLQILGGFDIKSILPTLLRIHFSQLIVKHDDLRASLYTVLVNKGDIFTSFIGFRGIRYNFYFTYIFTEPFFSSNCYTTTTFRPVFTQFL